LKAGSWLSIPSFDGSAAVIAPAEAVTPTVEIESANAINEAYEPAPVNETAAIEEVQSAADIEPTESSAEIILDDLTEAGISAGNLQPGDIILDAELEGPSTTATSPNVPTAIISTNQTSDTSAASTSWLFWLAGSGIAAILGLLMFGRRLRGQSDTSPAAPLMDATPQRRFSDTQATDTQSIEASGVDFNIADARHRAAVRAGCIGIWRRNRHAAAIAD
jgi:hypothetical protein